MVPDCLAEELRRLDPDEIYAAALAGVGRVSRGRSPVEVAPRGGPIVTNGPEPDIVVHRGPDVLAAAAAARLVTRLVDLQAAGNIPKLVLTGGGIGIALLEQLRGMRGPRRRRLVAGRVLLGRRAVPPARRPGAQRDPGPRGAARPPPDRPGQGVPDGRRPRHRPVRAPRRAAEDYAELLRRKARPEDHGPVPSFDVLLLGMGGEGHTASMFPHSPAVYETERSVVAVHGCPKPPPTRVSLTLPAIRRAAEVWILATGPSKAAAVAMALGGAGEVAIPVAGARGRRRTRWLLDRAAASKLPRDLVPPIG